jgi:transposase
VIPHGVEIFVCLEPIDLRWSFDRLSNLAEARVGREARCGALFVFFGRRQDALKVLFFDGTGMCQFYKRLDRHRFKVPVVADTRVQSIALEEHELDALLDGIEIANDKPTRRRPKRDEPPVH